MSQYGTIHRADYRLSVCYWPDAIGRAARAEGANHNMPERHLRSSLEDARERYLEVVKTPQHVRSLVVASWQRSMEYEVDTSSISSPYLENPNSEVPLVRAALPILNKLLEQLAGDPVSMIITDRDGVVLSRLVSHNELLARLDRVQLAPGYGYAERYVGTNGIGTALASGRPVTISGSEHYVEALRIFQCAAVPILHPTRRTLLGAFDLTTMDHDYGRLLMALARSTARQIESELAAISSQREWALFQDYMEACASARPGPVLALNRDIVMMNEQLQVAVAGQDHYALLDQAQEIANDSRFEGTRTVSLPSGRVAELRVSRCQREDHDAGAILHVRVHDSPHPSPAVRSRGAQLSLGLVGSSQSWLRAVAKCEAAFAARSWFCITGEAGTGKTALVEAIHRTHGAERRLALIEPSHSESEFAVREWLDDLCEHLTDPSNVVVMRNAHLLGPHVRRQLTHCLEHLDRAASGQLIMTLQPSKVDTNDNLHQLFDVWVEVPPIRHRHDDIEHLVRFFLRKYRPNGENTYTPAALALFQQCLWPENIRQIEGVIRGLVQRQSGRTIGVEDLPPECRVSSHNVLTPIEALERDAIVRGLIDRNSNVQRTAEDLGISRATMYRKMHHYGIVPSSLD